MATQYTNPRQPNQQQQSGRQQTNVRRNPQQEDVEAERGSGKGGKGRR